MKKTGKRCVAVIAFLLSVLLIFTELSEIMRKKTGEYSDMIHSFYKEKENTLDVICLGSSHGYSSFSPNVLWGEYGIASGMMSSPQQSLAMTYYLLKDALNRQTPKVVAIETYYFFFTKKYTETAMVRQAFDSMPFGKVKYEALEDILGQTSRKEKLSYYVPFLMYHSRWNSLKQYDFDERPFRKGAIHDYTVKPNKKPQRPEQATELPKVVKYYLEKIEELCKEKGVELVLYTAPYSYGKRNKDEVMKKQSINLTLKNYCTEQEIPYFDYQFIEDVGIDYATDFRDEMHLNTYGAEKISKHLGAFLKETYDLPDRREDGNYKSWQKDYELYCEEAVRLKAEEAE